MPYRCDGCDTEVEVDLLVCPGCMSSKTSWTVVPGMTRAIVVTKTGFSVLCAEGEEPVEPGDVAYTDLEFKPAEEAPVVTKEDLIELHEDGLLPSPEDVLFLKISRGKRTKVKVELEVIYPSKRYGIT